MKNAWHPDDVDFLERLLWLAKHRHDRRARARAYGFWAMGVIGYCALLAWLVLIVTR